MKTNHLFEWNDQEAMLGELILIRTHLIKIKARRPSEKINISFLLQVFFRESTWVNLDDGEVHLQDLRRRVVLQRRQHHLHARPSEG